MNIHGLSVVLTRSLPAEMDEDDGTPTGSISSTKRRERIRLGTRLPGPLMAALIHPADDVIIVKFFAVIVLGHYTNRL